MVAGLLCGGMDREIAVGWLEAWQEYGVGGGGGGVGGFFGGGLFWVFGGGGGGGGAVFGGGGGGAGAWGVERIGVGVWRETDLVR